MELYQQRVFAERAELDEKLAKLRTFFGTEAFLGLEGAEQARLQRQANAMSMYADVLGERIAAFKEEL